MKEPPKVKELIAFLQLLDPEMPILIWHEHLRSATALDMPRDMIAKQVAEHHRGMYRETAFLPDTDASPITALVIEP